MLKGTVATGGTDIPGDYSYQWKYSPDNSTWSPVTVAGTGINYQPASLSATTYFAREVTSGACTETGNTITVTVLPSIINNTISANQTVCYNTAPVPLTGTAPSGGNGTYTYSWQDSSVLHTWIDIIGAINSTYQPPVLTEPVRYRRIATSGDNGCCINTSNVIDITIYPPLPTGTITTTSDTTICEGSKISLGIQLSGSSPWNIVYLENSTQVAVNNIAGTDTILTATPATGTLLQLLSIRCFQLRIKTVVLLIRSTGQERRIFTRYRLPMPAMILQFAVPASL